MADMPLEEEFLEAAVVKALQAIELKPSDKATALLARRYAERIDSGEPPEKIGPLLLTCLEALLMTPRARAALVKGGESVPKPTSPLDQLLERRERRNGGAASAASGPAS